MELTTEYRESATFRSPLSFELSILEVGTRGGLLMMLQFVSGLGLSFLFSGFIYLGMESGPSLVCHGPKSLQVHGP